MSDLQIYLYKTVSPSQLSPAILASQDTRRKCSFFAGIVAVLSCEGFPILGSWIIRSIILSRPLVLLLLINISIIVGPLLLDAMKMIQHEANAGSSTSDVDIPDTLGSPFEWGMLLKTGLSAFFMDSCIYSVVVVCGMSLLQIFGLQKNFSHPLHILFPYVGFQFHSQKFIYSFHERNYVTVINYIFEYCFLRKLFLMYGR